MTPPPILGKASSWTIGFGCFLMLLGLLFLPAAFQKNNDPSVLGAGTCLFAFGSLSAAAGLYLKARAIQSSLPAADLKKQQPRRTRGGCDGCGEADPAILCRVHQVHLCGDCLADHYDFRSCAYVPSTRRTASARTPSRLAAKA